MAIAPEMRVDFYGVYRLNAGTKTIEFKLNPGASLHDLLYAVVEQFPSLRDEFFDPHGDLYAYIPLYLNGRNPRLLERNLDTILRVDDLLSIFSPISSGRINVEDLIRELE